MGSPSHFGAADETLERCGRCRLPHVAVLVAAMAHPLPLGEWSGRKLCWLLWAARIGAKGGGCLRDNCLTCAPITNPLPDPEAPVCLSPLHPPTTIRT